MINEILDWINTIAGKYDFFQADERRSISPGLLYELANNGLFGLQIASKYGGLNLSHAETIQVIERLASVNLTLATIVTTHANGVYAIEHYGSAKLKDEYLPLLARGQGMAAFALTEECAGSNVYGIESSARRIDQNNWIINGRKIWVDSGAWSSIIVTFCKVQEEGQQSKFVAFALPSNLPGLSIGNESYTMGLRSMVQNQIDFTNLVVAEDYLLGDLRDGLLIANASLDKSRLLLSVKALGASKRCLQLLLNYTQNRTIATGVLFNHPVASKISAEISLGVLALETACKQLADLLDKNIAIPSEILMMVKVFASELVNQSADNTLQLLGGRGYMEQNIIPQLLRDVKALKISEGANESLNSHIGSVLKFNAKPIYDFIALTLNCPQQAAELKTQSSILYDNCLSNYHHESFSEYWAYYLIGKFSVYSFLIASVEGSANLDPHSKKIALDFLSLQSSEILQQASVASSATLLLNSTAVIRSLVTRQVQLLPELVSASQRVETSLDKYLQTRDSDSQLFSILHGKNTLENISYSKFTNLAALVMDKFIEYGDQVAVVCLDESITYRQLLAQVNALAYNLARQGIQAGNIVGVCIDNSIALVIHLLGILKVGAIYIPLDPCYPLKRLEQMISDSKLTTILTTETRVEIVKTLVPLVIVLPITSSPLDQQAFSSLNPDALAYIIYTSGSTGIPKGVAIKHSAVINFLLSMQDLLSFSKDDVFMQHTTLNFDIAVLELFLPLMLGAKMVIVPRSLLYADKDLIRYIEQQQISVIQATPSFWQMLLEYGYQGHSGLIALAGGEVFHPALAQKLNLSCQQLWNLYGPTEATVWATAHLVERNSSALVAIGKPLNNVSVFLLNPNNRVVSQGEVGEICIAGSGLAAGYLQRDDLTAEKFIRLDINGTVNQLIYKSGDLGRIDEQGNLICLGRKDRQVKLSGHRIELGEIEHILLDHAAIVATAVIKFTDENNLEMLVAYLVTSAEKLDEFALRDFLKQSLPEYMIPTLFIPLDKLPLTLNSKIDYQALPMPVARVAKPDPAQLAISNVCAVVIAIWQELFRRKDISSQSDFFALGGNSLFALRIIAKIREQFKCNLTISELFLNSTISELASVIENSKNNSANYPVCIPKQKIRRLEDQLLSFAQQRLWFIQQYEGKTNLYNNSLLFEIYESVQPEIFEQALLQTILRHEVLYSLIKTTPNGSSYQVIGDLSLQPLSITHKQVANTLDLNLWIATEADYTFDLEHEYPIRVTLYSLAKQKYLGIVVHHIAFDGWSTDVFLRDLYSYYSYLFDLALGKVAELWLPALDIQYIDFALWQRKYLVGDLFDQQLAYWLLKLADYEQLNLTTDNPRPARVSYCGDEFYFKIEGPLANKLRSLAKDLQVSLFSLLLSAYYLLLRCYSNQDDIVIGTPVANRHYPQLENMLGVFVNSLVLRGRINAEQPICQFIQATGREVIDAQLHQDLPFEQLVEHLNINKDTSRHPVFQVWFGLQSFGTNLSIQLPNQSTAIQLLKAATIKNSHARFDLSLMINDSCEQLNCSLNYASSLFNRARIVGMTDTYQQILVQFASLDGNDLTKIKDVNYLSASNYQKVIYAWNQSGHALPAAKTMQELFEDQVARTPDNIALIYQEIQLSYLQLNQMANQLAHYLRNSQQIQGDDLIALCLTRSEHLLIAILAVLKSGAAYVPLDPGHPDERISYLIADSKAKVVLTNKLFQARINRLVDQQWLTKRSQQETAPHGASAAVVTTGTVVLAIDSCQFYQQHLRHESEANPQITIDSTKLAYLIYTSGTSGNPKGVMIEHRSYGCFIQALYASYFKPQQSVSTYSLTNYVFDIFGLEYALPLLSGGSVTLGFTDFASLDCLNYDFVQMTPSLCELKLEQLINTANTTLFIGGEALSQSLFQQIMANGIKLLNLYGPTETTIYSTTKAYNLNGDKKVSIGKPLPNQTAYVLDANQNPLPIGAIGELYLGGIGLARGYLNLPELSAEKFIANPFQTVLENQLGQNSRLYRSGDLVRYLANGDIEYLGRSDFQVKIRGYRIELGEIESKLASFPGIQQAVVLVKQPKSPLTEALDSINTTQRAVTKYLVGYYVSAKQLNNATILAYLSEHLADYMLPSILVPLAQLPLTTNGKLDRRSLPDPEFSSLEPFVAPRNEVESQLAAIFAELLGFQPDKVGITSDFFGLGGDSILALKLISQLKKNGWNVPLKDFYTDPTINYLAEFYLKVQRETKAINSEGIFYGS